MPRPPKNTPSGAKSKPINPLKSPRFADPVTFNRLPYVPDIQGKKVDVAILGVPYDGGTTYRPGARFGPRAVRDASVLNRSYHPDLGVGVFDRLNVVDAGDVAINPIRLESTYHAIEHRVGELRAEGAQVISVGGDHSILLPELRATVATLKQPLTLIHFDAHTDTGDQAWGEKYHHGTPIRRAIDEKLLQGSRIFQIGIRGPLSSPEQDDYIREQKINTLGMDTFHDPAARARFFAKLRKTAGSGPCFVTFDVDGVDPAFAPGTGTPVVGGMTSREALATLREIKGLNVIGGDVVEISPPFDHAELTSLLGAAILFEILSLMALSPARSMRK